MDSEAVQVSILAIIQGLTEFLPISSSGHLLLPSLLFGWTDQGLTFDVAVHIGSLIAVIIYFWQDLVRLLSAWIGSMSGRGSNSDARLAWLLILATIPAGVAGLLLSGTIESYARAIVVIAGSSMLFGLLLLWSDRAGTKQKELDALTWRTALLIGVAQMLALIPGTSRSGVTMTAALFCNLSRAAAARFSFLLSIPIIFATGLLKSAELLAGNGPNLNWIILLYAMVVSGLVAYFCIHYFLQLIERIGFLPFVVYRMCLGLLLFAIYFAA